jgi:hypothetical protein
LPKRPCFLAPEPNDFGSVTVMPAWPQASTEAASTTTQPLTKEQTAAMIVERINARPPAPAR